MIFVTKSLKPILITTDFEPFYVFQVLCYMFKQLQQTFNIKISVFVLELPMLHHFSDTNMLNIF